MKKSVLIVDDEEMIRHSLEGILRDEGYDVFSASSGEEALKIIEDELPSLVLLDIWLPGMDGLEALKIIKSDYPSVCVVMMSGHGTIETAVKATKLGAFDFIEKPLSLEKVILAVDHALDMIRLEEENRLLKQKLSQEYELTGSSPAIVELKEMISLVAPTNAWILIMGERNGKGAGCQVHPSAEQTGAQALHRSELCGHPGGSDRKRTVRS
jgi:two-component system nitrogen regulation response regulator NtrX